MTEELHLDGGTQTTVTVSGGVVYRSAKPQSRTVLDLLRYLEEADFPASPRVVGSGFDDHGREMLGYIEGSSPQPNPWSDEALAQLGALLRELHDVTSGFDFAPDAIWFDRFTRHLPGNHEVIGHGDLGPWNVLADNGMPVAFIDWDQAGPVNPMWELAEAAWLNVQLHDDDVAALARLPGPTDRARQLRIFVDAYGLPRHDRPSFVDRMAEFAIHSAAEEARLGEVRPESATPIDETGFPVMWAIAWRARAASWILRHRNLLLAALLEGS